jgi:hypothetical protein
VALVLLRIARLLERAQHQVGEDALLGCSGDAAHQALVHLRRDGMLSGISCCCGARESRPRATFWRESRRSAFIVNLRTGRLPSPSEWPKLRGRLLELDDALGVGHLVDAVDGRDALGLQPVRDALVGREHELLDEAVRPTPLRAHDGLHVAVGVELHHRLRQVEVDGAAADALGVQPQRQLEHLVEGLRQTGGSNSSRSRSARSSGVGALKVD